MTWGLIWLMFALKIPLAGLIYIVWWAIKQEPDESSSRDDDGGIKRYPNHPRKPFPRHPRLAARRPRAALAAAGADRAGADPHGRALDPATRDRRTPERRAPRAPRRARPA